MQISRIDKFQIGPKGTMSKWIRMINPLFAMTAVIIAYHMNPLEMDSATVAVIRPLV